MRCGKTETPGSVRGFQVIGLAGVGLSACLDPVHRHSPDARGAFGFDGFFGLGVAHGRVSVRGCWPEASWVSAVRAEGHEAWTRNGVVRIGEGAEKDSNLTGIPRRIRHLSSETTPVLGRLGMALDLQGVPVDRTHDFDAASGLCVGRRSNQITGLVPAIVPEELIWGDINQDANVNTGEVVTLLVAVSGVTEPEGNITGRQYYTPISDFESDWDNPAEIELNIRRGESYSVRVLYNRTQPDFWEDTCEHDFSYCASIVSLDPVKWPAIIVDEQDDDDPLLACYGTPLLCFDSHKCNPARRKHATLYLPIVDVDVDSDNNGAQDMPSRSAQEDAEENAADRNGTLVGFRGSDLDEDGVPDSVDGFNLTLDESDDVVLSSDSSASGFTPIVIEMAGFPPPDIGEEHSLSFQYDASDPNAIVVFDPLTRSFELPEGRGRLWTKDQLVQRDRRPAGAALVDDAGDFVPSESPVPVSRLGLTNSGQSTTTLYYEALDHSQIIGDIEVTANVNDDPRFSDTVRMTVPRLEIVTRSFTADSDDEEYEPFTVVHGSDPQPYVEYDIIDEGPLGPTIDPVTLAITLNADWTVSDPLSGVVAPLDQLEELRIYVDGQLAHTEQLSGSCAGDEFPFQECRFEASGTMQLTIPAPISPDGRPRSWGAEVIIVEARTSANAAGRVGINRSAIVFRLEETLDLSAPGAFISMEGDPNDPAQSGVAMRPVIDRIEPLYRSDGGVMEPLVFRLWPVDQSTAELLDLRMAVPPPFGSHEQALSTYQTLNLQPLDPDKEHVQYVTATVNGRPMQLVCLMDDEEAELPPVLPDNIRALRRNGELQFQISLNPQAGADERYERVVVLTMTEHEELTRDNESVNWDERPLTEGDIRTFYELLATDDKALQRLQTFEQWGGTIEIEDLGLIPFTDPSGPCFRLSSDSKRLVIDDDASPVVAAQYLTLALKQSLRWGPYRQFVMTTWDITEPDLDTWRDACDAMVAEMSVSAASWAQVIPLIASVVSEPVDFVITVHEVSKGEYAAAVGFIPFIPAQALAQGKRVLIQSTNGTQLMHLSSASAQLLQQVMSPTWSFGPVGAAQALKQAGLSVTQRISGIRSGIYPSLPVRTIADRDTKKLVRGMTDAGFPKPQRLFEGDTTPQVHHVLPFQYWDWFMAHGIDVNDPLYHRWVRMSDHSKLHNEASDLSVRYNQWWLSKIRDEETRVLSNMPEYTIQQIHSMIDEVREEFRVIENAHERSWTF